MTHEDERRTLTSIPYKEGEVKIIIAKQDCTLGNHYHKVKTETFQLLSGECMATVKGGNYALKPGGGMVIAPGMPHTFLLKKDSILFCICSHPYDKNDDYET